ncbi:MAG TPA: hypothetical protein DCF68_20980 [Cyanothece sp. UBA12306]|nr:hypothetical protein [Cyanothece sp. UBA12306]
MQSSTPSGKVSEPPPHKWAYIVGTIIAILTLTLPLLVIAYYSPQNNQTGLETHVKEFERTDN